MGWFSLFLIMCSILFLLVFRRSICSLFGPAASIPSLYIVVHLRVVQTCSWFVCYSRYVVICCIAH